MLNGPPSIAMQSCDSIEYLLRKKGLEKLTEKGNN